MRLAIAVAVLFMCAAFADTSDTGAPDAPEVIDVFWEPVVEVVEFTADSFTECFEASLDGSGACQGAMLDDAGVCTVTCTYLVRVEVTE